MGFMECPMDQKTASHLFPEKNANVTLVNVMASSRGHSRTPDGL